MIFLNNCVQTELAKALGWTLLHSLWEGAVAAAALAIVMGLARSSRVRYGAACLAMVGLLGGFVATFYRVLPRETGAGLAAARSLPDAVKLSPDDAPAGNIGTRWDVTDLLPWLAPAWIAGVLLFQLRCLASWMAAGRLRRVGVCGAPAGWTDKLDSLRARLRMTRPVTLMESYLAEVPVVIGHVRPIILMPVGLLAGLPIGQIESILLHELAHIRRADYLVNLVQSLVEGLLFYHPAVWWISRVIRTERENCCDDLVVAAHVDAHEYATALAALAEQRWSMRDAAIAATGGHLVKRIRRLLARGEGPRPAMAPALSAGVLIVTCALALAAWQTPTQNSPAIVPVIPVAQAPVLSQDADGKQARAKEKSTADRLESLREAMKLAAGRPAPTMLLAQNERAPLADSLATPYRRWLIEEVAYIITNEERAAYRKLETDDERKRFIEQFWARRDPTPGTAENEYRQEHYRRIAYVNDRFGTKIPGWKTDRGRIYIQYGPPDEIESHPGGKYTRPPEEGGGETSTYPFEQWRYRWIQGMGKNVIMEFVDKDGTGEYRMTMDPKEKDALATLVPALGPSDRAVAGGGGRGGSANGLLQMKIQVTYATAAQVLTKRLIEPGDVLSIVVFREPELTMPREVRTDGRITMPLIGDVQAAGLTAEQLRALLKQALLIYITNPDVAVNFAKIHGTAPQAAMLTQITVQFDTKDLHFQSENNVSTATINIYGRISTLEGRPLAPFEDVVKVTLPPLLPDANPHRTYQKTLPLLPGTYRINIAAKDIASGNSSTSETVFEVPAAAQ